MVTGSKNLGYVDFLFFIIFYLAWKVPQNWLVNASADSSTTALTSGASTGLVNSPKMAKDIAVFSNWMNMSRVG